jgi:hypothetical protein
MSKHFSKSLRELATGEAARRNEQTRATFERNIRTQAEIRGTLPQDGHQEIFEHLEACLECLAGKLEGRLGDLFG